jgi:hypothetical protein
VLFRSEEDRLGDWKKEKEAGRRMKKSEEPDCLEKKRRRLKGE